MMTSIHTANISQIYDVPIEVITRPLVAQIDSHKVDSLVETLKDPRSKHLVPPIDIIWVTEREADYYYSFSGIHRYEAYRVLNAPTIPCKIVRSNADVLSLFLGGSFRK